MRTASLVKLKSGAKYAVRIHRPDGTHKTIKFGEHGAEDFTIHKDRKRRLLYLDRHGRKRPSFSTSTKEEWTQDGIFTAGYWSRWLLWEKDTLKKAIEFMNEKKNIKISYRKK